MRLIWRIYLYFFVSTLIALAAIDWYASRSLGHFFEDQVASDLLVRARIMGNEVEPLIPQAGQAEIDRRCKVFGRLTQTRVTIILPDGRVVGDSDQDPASMENHMSRPEVVDALKGHASKAIRFSDTLRRNLMYLAIPVHRDGEILAVVRTSLPLATIEWTLQPVYRHIVLGGLIVAVLFGLVALYLSRRISRPLDDMRRVAERLAKGDLGARVTLPNSEELRSLAQTLNQMAAQLNERMTTILRQSNEQKAVFSSMVEGVLAVDREERILHLNDAATRLLDLVPIRDRGRSIQEAVRNLDLQKFITTTFSAENPVEAEVVLHGNEERFLNLHGTALKDADGTRLGVLVVLNDITRMKRLERVRQDFVANVSHELKTPITALKGCVETLSDDAHRNPEDVKRFLGMIERQVERLGAIVEDLLSLSRLEHDAEQRRIPFEQGCIGDVLRRAVQSFGKAAETKKISIALECPGDVSAPINAAFLEQAVGNLIDNAIKYSGEETRIDIKGFISGDDVVILVRDEGPGIEKKHLPRIFERFYRVDQARSRGLGGTGLGLAIVKHIALAHRGSVSVESVPMQGSTFTIRLPRQ